MIHYDSCPYCSSTNIVFHLEVKDFTVSGKVFQLYKCPQCTGVFTQDIPRQEDIGAYYASDNYISHSDTQQGLINRLYHIVRKRTLLAKRKLLQSVTGKDNGIIADIGCGTGAFLQTMQAAGWQITGLEPDETARKNARELSGIDPLPSQELFNLPQQHFDAITMWHVLEHVHQLHEYLDQVKLLLKDSGKFIVAVPNYTSYDASHYQANWAAYDVPRHLYHFSPKSMRLLVAKHGMKLTNLKPMWFDSFYVSMLSEQYKNGKGNILKAMLIGFISNLKTVFNRQKCSSLIYIIEKEKQSS